LVIATIFSVWAIFQLTEAAELSLPSMETVRLHSQLKKVLTSESIESFDEYYKGLEHEGESGYSIEFSEEFNELDVFLTWFKSLDISDAFLFIAELADLVDRANTDNMIFVHLAKPMIEDLLPHLPRSKIEQIVWDTEYPDSLKEFVIECYMFNELSSQESLGNETLDMFKEFVRSPLLTDRVRSFTLVMMQTNDPTYANVYYEVFANAKTNRLRAEALRPYAVIHPIQALLYIEDDLSNPEKYEPEYITYIARLVGYIGSNTPSNISRMCLDLLIDKTPLYFHDSYANSDIQMIMDGLFFALIELDAPEALVFLIDNREYFNSFLYIGGVLECHDTLLTMLGSSDHRQQECALEYFIARPYKDLAFFLNGYTPSSEHAELLLQELWDIILNNPDIVEQIYIRR